MAMMARWVVRRIWCLMAITIVFIVLTLAHFSSLSGHLFSSEETYVGLTDTILPIWPLPRYASVLPSKEMSLIISKTVNFNVRSSSKILRDAVERYKLFIPTGDDTKCAHKTVELNTINVLVSDGSEDLNGDRKYEIIINSEIKDVTIVASSPFGAIYGLETISQLFYDHSCISYSQVHIKDYPMYRHRGLLLDVGRRIAPKELVFTLLDSLSYLKMNVLHFHLSDFCRYSIESKVFPQLTAHLKPGQFYTKKDVRDIIEYARQRGIRVIPEIELPGHTKGLEPLKGEHIVFCDDHFKQIYNDPEGKSVKTLKKLIRELASIFPDRYMHMGSDETTVGSKCTLKGMASMEKEIAQYIISLGKTPIAWEEALFRSGVEVPGMAYQAWKSYRATNVTARNYESIESHSRYFYMDVVQNRKHLVPWLDIARGDEHSISDKLLGGEIAMWTDQYCETRQCWDEPNWEKKTNAPRAYWMFTPQYDKQFSKSLQGMIWPKGIPAAGSFWNYNKEIKQGTTLYQSLIQRAHEIMISRGIQACPVGCTCSELQQCEVEY